MTARDSERECAVRVLSVLGRLSLFKARLLFQVLLLCAVAGVAMAQETSKQESSKKEETSPDRVVLKVGGVSVTKEDFESTVGEVEPEAEPDADPDAKDRRQYGDDYATVLILSKQALANHLDADPDVKRQLAINRLQILSDAQFASLMKASKPSEQEVSDYYAAHLADFDEVLLRRLFIWKVGAGSKNAKGLPPEQTRDRANAILQAQASGGDPEKLAQAFNNSEDGMLDVAPPTFTRGALSPSLEKIAFALKPKEWAEGEDTPDRIMLMQLVKHGRRPLAEVSPVIEQRLQSARMQVKLDELKKNAGIWMDDQYFGKAVATEPGEQRPVSNPPSTLRKSEKEKEKTEERSK
jgi:hypothetical protein